MNSNYGNYESQIYLDACATTPVRKEVIDKISEVQFEAWGNHDSGAYIKANCG